MKKSRTGSVAGEGLASPPVATVQLPLPLWDAITNVREGFFALCVATGQQVLATGGGAFMNSDTRTAIRAKGVSVWLKADFEVLMRRVKRRATADRPMLQGDPAQRIRQLMDERYPVYAEADVTVVSREVSHEIIVNEIVAELARVLGVAAAPATIAEAAP